MTKSINTTLAFLLLAGNDLVRFPVYDEVYGYVEKETHEQWIKDDIDSEQSRREEAVKRRGYEIPPVRNPDIDWPPFDEVSERTVRV